MNEDDIVYRLRKRAEIRRQIADRKSVQEGRPDRIADLLEEAAIEIERLRNERTDETVSRRSRIYFMGRRVMETRRCHY
jgi:Mg2+ and Co2+ transporter CorA